MSALDAFLGFTRMIGGGLASAYTARRVRWGTGFSADVGDDGEVTVSATGIVGIGAINGNLPGPVAGVTTLDLGTQLAATSDVSGDDRFLRLGIAAAVLPQWRRALDVDFAAAPSGDLLDGEHTIGGATFFVENSAARESGASPIRIVNGEGLVLPSNADGTYYAYRTVPLIRLGPLLTIAQLGRPLRVRARLATTTGTGTIWLVCGVELLGSGALWHVAQKGGAVGGASTFSQHAFERYCGGAPVSVLGTLAGANDIVGVSYPMGVGPILPAAGIVGRFAHGAWDYPAEMTEAYIDLVSRSQTTLTASTSDAAAHTVVLAAEMSAPSSTAIVTVRGLRVDCFY